MKDFECPICLEIFNMPIVLACGHTFCRSCIEQQKQNSNKCPSCRKHISWGHPCYALKSIIEKYSLTIKTNDKNTLS
jgi:hypothetical protein